MSYNFYKVLHLTAVFIIFLSLGGAVFRSLAADASEKTKKLIGAMCGAGLLIAFVAGFGLMAKLGIGFDGWVLSKLVIWLIMGGLLAVANRAQNLALPVAGAAILLGALAAYLAVAKPF